MMSERIYAIISAQSTADVQGTVSICKAGIPSTCGTIHQILVHIVYYPWEGILLDKAPETFELELLGFQTVFSSHSPLCFLAKVLLFSLAAFLLHQIKIAFHALLISHIVHVLTATKRVY